MSSAGVDAEELGERLRLERLLEHGRGEQDAVAPAPSARHWASSASASASTGPAVVPVRERLGDEARVAAGRRRADPAIPSGASSSA